MDILNNIKKIKISKLWKDYGYSFIVFLCILILLLVSIYNFICDSKGSWSKNHKYITEIYKDLLYVNNLKYIDDEIIKIDNKNQKQIKNNNLDSKGEVECRRVLENIFKRPFKKARPIYLKNEITNNSLELDCYNKELSLAVEYNGEQHYKYNKFFHSSKEAFKNQQYRDYMKRELCKKFNIKLIEVPYTVKLENIEKYLVNELRNINYIY
jgi:hypothetical protein